MTIRYIGESRKRNKNTGLFGWMPRMQIITDQFGDGWHESILNIFVGQQSDPLLGDGIT